MREIERVVRAEIARVGGVIDREERGSHLKLYWSLGSEKFFQVVSFSPSCFRSQDNVRAQIRRNVRLARQNAKQARSRARAASHSRSAHAV